MVYNRIELAREIRNMIQSIIYENTQYVETFSYEILMENNWKSYEEINYPAIIRAKDIEVGAEQEVKADGNVVDLGQAVPSGTKMLLVTKRIKGAK